MPRPEPAPLVVPVIGDTTRLEGQLRHVAAAFAQLGDAAAVLRDLADAVARLRLGDDLPGDLPGEEDP